MRISLVLALALLAGCVKAQEEGLAGRWSATPRATLVYDGFGNTYDAVTVDLKSGPTLADGHFAGQTPLLVRAESPQRYVVIKPSEVPAGSVQIVGKLVPQRLVFGQPTPDSPSRTIARESMLRNGQPVYEYVLIVGKFEPATK